MTNEQDFDSIELTEITQASFDHLIRENSPSMVQIMSNGKPRNRKPEKIGQFRMTKKSRGGKITAPKRQAADWPGVKGIVRNRTVGRNSMEIW
jgi:hypothetical protein